MKERITPVGLKGFEITERMKELMGKQIINENRSTSVVELTKAGPDGKVYGIVRENHEYYIKINTSNKNEKLVAEDFAYIGGLMNKKKEVYPSYAKAIKHLNLKFNSLNEALGKSGQINVFEDDNLQISETKSDCCDASINEGMCSECGKKMINEEEVDDELTETDKAVEDMMDEEEIPSNPEKPEDQPGFVHENRLSIAKAIDNMDAIIDGIVKPNKKKVYTLK